ncbi:hypothetical protein CAPTEDRAFT_193515 [Capitella teleta]|uniref:IPT/TIG domain-containing protein n=1 Tax=Capitella teleta TaxID=283909 RepID=R7UED8_CAPTE|nr:hypothetical protein CAPTEDRAFT_193515 [Capitella teleta]|eukprot:ELU04344.1 hypothetical protein CAPTEDRAFT_193515 [Capitella teleta]
MKFANFAFRKYGLALYQGGTLLTVTGSHFEDVEGLQLTLMQLAGSANSSQGMHVFPSVNYGPLECSVLTARKMICITPPLLLPSMEEFGSFEAEYEFRLKYKKDETFSPLDIIGITFNSIDLSLTFLREVKKSDFSLKLTVAELASIEEHQWSPYDKLTEEPLEIKVAWGAFQQEAEIYVGGIRANVTKRYHNLILFFPPGEEQIIANERLACRESPAAHVVEVHAGNANRHVGCLQYATRGGEAPVVLIASVASGVVVFLVVALSISSCVVWKRMKSTQKSRVFETDYHISDGILADHRILERSQSVIPKILEI